MSDHEVDRVAHRACPPWCRRDHLSRVHPDDQHHVSAPRRVAVVSGRPALEPDELAIAAAVVARLIRRTHSDLTWVEVVTEEGRDVQMVLTLESARSLLAVLQDLVAAAVA